MALGDEEHQQTLWRDYGAGTAPGFLAESGIPDSLQGRFALLSLHLFTVFHRLKGEGAEALATQALIERFSNELERCFGKMG